MEAAGVPAAFIQAALAGVPPTADSVAALPATLGALCLNTSGLELVRSSGVLFSLVPMFTTTTYLRSLQGPAGVVAALRSPRHHSY